MGEWIHWSDIVTPAGIRQAFPLHSIAPDHLKWTRTRCTDGSSGHSGGKVQDYVG